MGELEDDTGRDREALQEHVGDVEVGGLGEVPCQDVGDGCWVLDDLSRGSGSGRSDCRDEEDLDHEEDEIVGLDFELDGGARGLAGKRNQPWTFPLAPDATAQCGMFTSQDLWY